MSGDVPDELERDNATRDERKETDASLRAERTKTDEEFARKTASVETDADVVVEVARDLADATLRAARDRADQEMTEDGAAPDVRRAVKVERAAQDGVLADEREVAEELLIAERVERQRALTALLSLEREATDDGLLVERARADEALQTRDDFLAMVSHDLRAMLGGIAMSAAMLAKFLTSEGDHGAATLKHAERIQRFTARMNRLVGDLIDVVSLEAGKLHVAMSPVDGVKLAEEAAETFAPSFAAKGIGLGSSMPDGAVMVACDRERVMQVLANLLSNALKFTETGGQVTLSVARSEAGVCFSVADTGMGIPDDQRLAIFERFRQVKANDRPGLGLGLYIAKCIIEAHDGTIWSEGRQPRGTTLFFTLPQSETTAN